MTQDDKDTPTPPNASAPTAHTPLSVALTYAQAGLNVLPVLSPSCGRRGAGKAPCLEAWQHTRLDPERLREELSPEDRDKRSRNIGVVTGSSALGGSGLVCIDLDGAAGVAWYMQHEDRLGAHLVERRGEQNLHLFFRYPSEESLQGMDHLPSRIRLFPGVDVLADGGRQVVTWPSIHRSRQQYVFDHGLSLLDLEAEADEPPQWLIEAILLGEEKRPVSLSASSFIATAQDIDRAREVLARHRGAVEGEAGDHATFRAAMICHDHGLSPVQSLELLWAEYNPRCRPPWSRDELGIKVKNAFKYAKQPAGHLAAAADFANLPPPEEGDFPPRPQGPQEGAPGGEPGPRYVPKQPLVCARAYLDRHPNETITSLGELHRYDHRASAWEILDTEQFSSLVLRDIDRAAPALTPTLRPAYLKEISSMVKHVLEGDAPKREVPINSWLPSSQHHRHASAGDEAAGEFVTCKNGIVNIATGELIPHSPEWFSFTTLPFSYDPAATCPAFDSFLSSIWPDAPELIDSLRLWMGYLLIGSMREQKFSVFIGASRAGKGTLVRVIENLLGKHNVAACSMASFGGDFGLEPLVGKRLAIFNDAEQSTGERSHIATERIKSITGNDSVPVNRKGRGILTLALPAKLMLVCNAIPKFCNDEGAITNRMLAFPFTKSFAGQEDTTLAARLQAELPGVMNWALEGARRLLAGERLKQSDAGRRTVEEIAITLDSVKGFATECIEVTNKDDSRVLKRTVYDAYTSWCRDNGHKPKSHLRFGKDLKAHLGTVYKEFGGAAKGYYGISLHSGGDFTTLTDVPAQSFHNDDDPPF